MKNNRTYLRLISLFLATVVLFSGSTSAEDSFDLKAAFTYNFAKFTQWPQARIEQASAWTICFYGNQYRDSFNALEKKKIAAQGITAVELSETSKIEQCDVVFIDSGSRELTRRIFLAVDSKAILTVSDIAGFVSQGGMIEIVEQDKRLFFKVNIAALERAGLNISSQVLKLAIEVKR
ncbi:MULTISPECIES: YfiR family protein [Shewanella]|jgi:hypothetical protein|uniref:YfiR family protein n=1 Tax=Shewanella TaxID=22 RepID=UPI000026422E|nr:YfiR family protein [Shewanella basaltis]MCL1112795.1 YfiR family protein [Shewanella basaltis]